MYLFNAKALPKKEPGVYIKHISLMVIVISTNRNKLPQYSSLLLIKLFIGNNPLV